MRFVTRAPDDGPLVIELDAEGIDWLAQGLRELETCEPGGEVSCPSFIEDDAGVPSAATTFVLLRAREDDD